MSHKQRLKLTPARGARKESAVRAPAGGGRAYSRLAYGAVSIAILLAVALAVGLGRGPAIPNASATDSAVTTWVWHFDPTIAEGTVPAYRDLLDALPQDVRVFMVVGSADAERLCRRLLGAGYATDKRLAFLRVTKPFGAWARDFYVPFDKGGRAHVYAYPRAAMIPRQRGALQVPPQLKARDASLQVVTARFGIVGGDVLLTRDRVLLGASSVQRLVGTSADAVAGLREEVESAFGRRLLIVGGAGSHASPYFHLDMFLTVLDDETLLLGDPRLAMEVFPKRAGAAGRELLIEGLGLFRRDTQERLIPLYARIATQLEAEGFELKRMPILHAEPNPADGRPGAVVNWNNVVLERRGGLKIAYVSRCGLPSMDGRAHALWRRMGYVVHSIDCRGAIIWGGGVRCLTNGLRQSAPLRAEAPSP